MGEGREGTEWSWENGFEIPPAVEDISSFSDDDQKYNNENHSSSTPDPVTDFSPVAPRYPVLSQLLPAVAAPSSSQQ